MKIGWQSGKRKRDTWSCQRKSFPARENFSRKIFEGIGREGSDQKREKGIE